jgi:hypothetical protein
VRPHTQEATGGDRDRTVLRIREIFPLLLFLLGLEWRMMVSVSGPDLHAANKKRTEDCVAY